MPRQKKQLPLPLPILCAKDIPFGGLFSRIGRNDTLMRVKPVGYILNSSLVNEAINKNNVFAISTDTGNLRILDGYFEVEHYPLQHLSIVTWRTCNASK